MKTTRHSLLAKGLMVLLSLLILIFAFTYSWFTVPEEINTASGISAKTLTGSDFEYAIGFNTSQTFGEYLVTDFTSDSMQNLDVEHLNVPGKNFDYNLLYDYSPIDITGDGVNLIRPSMEYGNWEINKGTNDYSTAEPNTQYISFDIIVRSKSPATLSLGPESYAVGAAESVTSGNVTTDYPDGTRLLGASAPRQSDYGTFSKDAIVGAVRVAFIDFDNEQEDLTADDLLEGSLDNKLSNTPSLLWVPRPDLYLNNNGHDEDVTGWSLNTGVANGATFELQSKGLEDSSYSTYRHQQYNIFNNSDNHIVTNTNDYVHVSQLDSSDNSYRFKDTVELTKLAYPKTVRENNEDVTYYYGKVRVRVWIEGTDSESRRALSGGKFKFSFDLTTNA